jgi:ribonuclease HI
MYTDGGAIGNPGPGGYGVIVRTHDQQHELSGGFRYTTNNRMEIMAAIVGLRELTEPSTITIYTDSQYLANAINKGWAQRWRANGWKRNRKERALNPDLWEVLLTILEPHQVTFEWLRGHSGHPENERCHALVQQVVADPQQLPPDTVYEQQSGYADA